MIDRIEIGEFNKPTESELILLKDELASEGIEYLVEGEEGQVTEGIRYYIKVFVAALDEQKAKLLYKEVKHKIKEKGDIPSFCPNCDSTDLFEIPYRSIIAVFRTRKFKCRKCDYSWKTDRL